MTELTVLDQAHGAMMADEADDAARLRFYERLAESEMFMLLAAEAEGDQVTPALFEVSDSRYVLIFDREDRLAQFVGQEAPYAALSGRMIASLLAGQGIGLGVNLEVAPSSILIPAEAVSWLHQTLGQAPEEAEARIEEIGRPMGLPEALLTAIDAKLATATGLAHSAYLAGATYEGGARNHLLAFIDVVPGAEDALARAVSEALTFSGIEAGALDVSFLRSSDPLAAKLAQWGLRFDLPQPEEVQEVGLTAPGMDPEKPPRLR